MFAWILLIGSFGLLQLPDVAAQDVDHPLIVTAIPYVQDVYYFNKGAELVFKVSAKFNSSISSSDPVTNIKLSITSVWLDITGGEKIDFNNIIIRTDELILQRGQLSSSDNIIGNVTSVVKDNINPLSSLFLQINGTASYQGSDIRVVQKSTPIVYAVFPEVNVTREHFNDVNIYESLHFEMKISLPKLDASLFTEITTNVDDFIFMEIDNITVLYDNAIKMDGTAKPVKVSSKGNQEIDRVAIDFGNVTASDVLDDAQRTITVGFDIKLNDDPMVENGRSYDFGVGLLAGPEILWVQHQTINVSKGMTLLHLKHA